MSAAMSTIERVERVGRDRELAAAITAGHRESADRGTAWRDKGKVVRVGHLTGPGITMRTD